MVVIKIARVGAGGRAGVGEEGGEEEVVRSTG